MRDTAFALELNRLCEGGRFYKKAFIPGLISRPIHQHRFESPWLIKGHFGFRGISDHHESSGSLVRNKDDLSKTSCLDKESLKIILKPDMSTSSNLHWVDYAVIIGYFAVVIAVGIFSSIKVFPLNSEASECWLRGWWLVILQKQACLSMFVLELVR